MKHNVLIFKRFIFSHLIFIIFYLLIFLFKAYSLLNVEKNNQMNSLYKEAVEYYKNKEYTKAIESWEKILKIDPNQKTPSKMIDSARDLIKASLSTSLKEAEEFFKKGQYKKSYDKFIELSKVDDTNYRIKNLSSKLETVIKFFTTIYNTDKYYPLLLKSLNEFIDSSGDVRLTMMTFIYLSQLEPDNFNINNFLEYLKLSYPEIYNSEKPAAGTSIIEQKFNNTIYLIEQKNYELSIRNCNDILFLDENNINAMAQIGTSYYLLGRIDKAKEIWKKAIEIAPNHPAISTIKEFLKNLR